MMWNFVTIIFTIIISLLAICLAMSLFNYIWVKSNFVEIPIDIQDSDERSKRIQKTLTMKSLSELISTFLPIWRDLDPKYCISNVGLDAYSYIYYQREILKM